MTDELQEVQEEQPQADEPTDAVAEESTDEPSPEAETAIESETTAEGEMDDSQESDQGEDSAEEESADL
jgi:hypothetical protein